MTLALALATATACCLAPAGSAQESAPAPAAPLAAAAPAAAVAPVVAPAPTPAESEAPVGEIREPVEVPASPPGTPTGEESPELTAEQRAARRAKLAAETAAERITFELAFPPERGGGSASGSAGALDYESVERVVATGGVEVKYQDVILRADTASVDLATKTVVASGNVIIDQGDRRLTGTSATFELETKTGSMTDATAKVATDYFFEGEEIAKTGENTYRVRKGLFTSCAGDDPDWSFRIGEGNVEVDGYARVKHASMRVKKVPVLYFPYILWPVKPERTSGMLIPNVGYSARRGAYLGLAYYKVFGRSVDDTTYVDLYSKEYFALGNELRYRPSEGTNGNLKGYAVEDPEQDEVRWKLTWDHRSDDLFRGMRAVVSYRNYSDFEFFQDFERDFDVNSARFLYSNAYLSGNWGPHSLNVLVDSRETFIRSGQTILQRQLPEIEYRLRPRKLGASPLYLEMRSSVHYLDVDRGAAFDSTYGRADLFPQLTLPLRAFPWLSVSLAAGGRATWYGDSLQDPTVTPVQGFTGESLTRAYPVGSAEIVGPSFSRIFERPLGRYGKFKHVIEPRFSYSYIGEFEEQAEVPLFDEIDFADTFHTGRVALVNRLLGKPSDPKKGSAREVLSLELAQIYSFDEEQPGQFSNDREVTDPWGPVIANLRFVPTDALNLQTRFTYSTLFSRVDSTSLSATWRLGQNTAGVTWFTRWDAETGDTRSDQIRLNGGVPLLGKALRLNAQIAYDIETSFLQQQRYLIDYAAKCWSLRVEFREFRAAERRDRDWRFALTLKNVGTFLDINGGDRSGSGQF